MADQLEISFNGWPVWTIRVCAALLVTCLSLMIVIQLLTGTSGLAEKPTRVPQGFTRFQRKYLCVYFVVMLADWLQGTNMWTLYNSYDVDIGTLFSTGWVSSAFFSMFVGTFVDKYGRKKGCIVYCLLEIVINLLEHVPSFEWLLVGRVMGGLSTCLLFSVFESWYDSAQLKHFPNAESPEKLIQQTASFATVGNWMMGVSAGVLAQVAADFGGEVGPFQLAIALTVLALVLILAFFDENVGGEVSQGTLTNGFLEGLNTLRNSPSVLLVMMGQTLYEGSTYTFVFMWVPVMIGLVGPPPALPVGLVFTCFMLCGTIGAGLGHLAYELTEPGTKTAEYVATLCAASFALAMAGCALYPDSFEVVFGCFLMLETSIGASYAAYFTLRARLIPEDTRATVTNLFRVPLNLCVVTGTMLTDRYTPHTVFPILAVWLGVATLCQVGLALGYGQGAGIGQGSKKVA